jgi:hypothetical protein
LGYHWKYRFCGWVLFVHIGLCSWAQSTNFIRGIVADAENGASIPGCSVFINSTSRGTVTSKTGEFDLQNVPVGSYELIVSCVGYETYVFSYQSSKLPLNLHITLRRKSTELSTVIVEPYDKNGWEKWGKTFMDNFIGVSENSHHCRIKNTNTLRFRFSRARNKLSVGADDPLIIENNALGYEIRFDLQEFSIDFTKQIIVYFGYPLFSEMTTTRAKLKERWNMNRQKAYLGSVAHFLRTIYLDQFQLAGFQVSRHVMVPNLEKQRVQSILSHYDQKSDTFQLKRDELVKTNSPATLPKDSIRYYRLMLLKPDSYPAFSSLKSAASLLSGIGDPIRKLFFTDTLFVIYSNPKMGAFQQSEICLITPAPVNLESNGHYFPPQEVLTMGYWAREEKVDNELPLDFDLPQTP